MTGSRLPSNALGSGPSDAAQGASDDGAAGSAAGAARANVPAGGEGLAGDHSGAGEGGQTAPGPGRRALVWSFFVPPVGAVLGLLAMRALPKDEAHRSARSEARLAMINGVVSTLIIAKLIWVLVHLREWMEAWLYGSGWP